jgi:DNA-binding CsgD family transcriptional regulator
MVLHVLPVRRTAHDIFPSGEILVAATLVGIGHGVPSLAMLHALFDLTPAEARLAASLAAGLPLKAAAARQQIQLSTARSYLETIFRKTATRQQSQLVALLKSAQPLTSTA